MIVGSLAKEDHNIPPFIPKGNANDEPRGSSPSWVRSLLLLNARGRRIRAGLDPHR